jgi:hypothetical protein
MGMYNFGSNYFTTNEISAAITQAWIVDLRINKSSGYDGCPRIVATRNGGSKIDEKNDNFKITLTVGKISSSLVLTFADAANHAIQFRKQEAPDEQLCHVVREAVARLESMLQGDIA